jgi:hypothetical protein
MLPLMLLAPIAAEITKIFLSRQGPRVAAMPAAGD